MLNWALYVLLPVCNIQVFFLHLSECFLTLPFRCLICDHIKVWQLPKSSFPNSSACFPSQRLTLDPETPHLVKLNCYLLFPSAHSVPPEFAKMLSLTFRRGRKGIFLSEEQIPPFPYYCANKQSPLQVQSPSFTPYLLQQTEYDRGPTSTDVMIIWRSEATPNRNN